jgi:hypothetical protein
MNWKIGVVTAAAVSCLAGTCLGQVSLYLIKTENFDLLSKSEASPGVPEPDNTFWIGHTPTAIAYGKGRLFIGGILNGSALPLDGADADGDLDTTEVTPFTCSIVKVNDILKSRSFSTIPGSRYNVSNTRGYTGMDYAPNEGTTIRGLVASCDTGGGGTNLVSRYNVDVAGNGVLAAPVPNQTWGFRGGSAGPAWDFGPTGLGVDYLPNGSPDGTPDGPAVMFIPFGIWNPIGLDPATMNPNFGATLYEDGVNNGPRLAPVNEGQLLWRDLCVDRRNGNIAARSDNTVTFVTRNADNSATRVDLSPSDPTTERIVPTLGSFIIGQNIAIMSGFDPSGVGDLLAWNDRSSTAGGQAFTSVVRYNKTNRVPSSDSGAPVTVNYLNPDNSPATFPSGIGLYDFFWDPGTQILFVLDAANRNVYLLSAERPRACCLSNGSCFLLNPTACVSAEVGGTAGADGSICSPNPCSQPPAACCAADGSCTFVDAATCTSGGGTPGILGSTCEPNLCTPSTGACCNGTVCSTTTAGGCTGTFQGAGTVCEFPSNPVTCCRANFNQAGGVTVQDIFDFRAAYFSGSPSADINGAGGVTVQDIFDYLSLYFAGCAN